MAKTINDLNRNKLSMVFGALLLVMGLVILSVVSLSAYKVATGAAGPPEVGFQYEDGIRLSRETSLWYGIVLQIGMFAIMVGAGYTLMRFGLELVQNRP